MRLVIQGFICALLVTMSSGAPVIAQNQSTPSATPGAMLEPQTLTAEHLAELDAYIATMLEKTQIPGAAVAIVQNGQVIYENGFGVHEVDQPEPVTPETPETPETLMMIGSVTKSMTATMAATLVDAGRLRWDTPVVDLPPGFAVADPDLTQAMIVRNAFCACTGLPQRDADFILNSDNYTPESLIASVAAFPLAAPLGKLFQYSNQMFAIGGYAATAAASGETDDLYDAYVRVMGEQLLAPLGMTRSTFSLEEVEASGDYAGSHGRELSGAYVPVALDDEDSFVRAVAPAGALWSSAAEMAHYVQMELGRGIAPDGTRVISEENLGVTWQPQVAVPAPPAAESEGLPPELIAMGQGYALGWLTGDYFGQRLLTHSGGTFGFVSQIALLPDADFGIVVLTNGVGAEVFTLAVQFRAFELLYDQPATGDPAITAAIDATTAQTAAIQVMLGTIDPESMTPYLGDYTSDTLGDVTVALQDGALILDVGEFQSELQPILDESGAVSAYLMSDPPLAGQVAVMFTVIDGLPVLNVIDPTTGEQYPFTFATEISAATPAP